MAYSFDMDSLGDRPLGEYPHTRFLPTFWVAGYETKTPRRIGSYGTPMFAHSQWVVPEGLLYEMSEVSKPVGRERNYLGQVSFPKLRTMFGARGTRGRLHQGPWKQRRKLLMAVNTRSGNLPTPAMTETRWFQRDPVRYEMKPRHIPELAVLNRTEQRHNRFESREMRMQSRLANPNLSPEKRARLEKRYEGVQLREAVLDRKKDEVIARIRRNPRLVYLLKADPVIRAEIEHNPNFQDIRDAIGGHLYWGSQPNN